MRGWVDVDGNGSAAGAAGAAGRAGRSNQSFSSTKVTLGMVV